MPDALQTAAWVWRRARISHRSAAVVAHLRDRQSLLSRRRGRQVQASRAEVPFARSDLQSLQTTESSRRHQPATAHPATPPMRHHPPQVLPPAPQNAATLADKARSTWWSLDRCARYYALCQSTVPRCLPAPKPRARSAARATLNRGPGPQAPPEQDLRTAPALRKQAQVCEDPYTLRPSPAESWPPKDQATGSVGALRR